jgi:hypothetical protein
MVSTVQFGFFGANLEEDPDRLYSWLSKEGTKNKLGIYFPRKTHEK